jgi:hypothetical protein
MKIIRNNSTLTNEEVIKLATDHDEFFAAAGLKAKGENAYLIRDGGLIQGGEVRNAEIVIDHG